MPDASVRSLAERPDGGVDVLLSSHRDNRAQTQRLAVVRITRDGGARRVWSQRTGTGIARIAAGPSGASAVLWTDAGPRHGGVSQPILRVAVAPRGGRFGPARTLRGVLSAGLLSEGYFFDVGLAVDSRDRLLVALPIWRKAGGILVLASLRGDGALVTRQALPGPEGLVHVATAPSGRAAVLVEETGIEGESGECVSSHVPRQVWAVLRAPGADRFAAPQALERRPLECAAVRAQLVMAATGRAVVLWGTAPETDPPPGPTIRMAEAAPGEPFGTPVTAPFGPMLGSAAFRAGEELTVATLAPSDLLQPYRGPRSVVTRSVDGALGARAAAPGAPGPGPPRAPARRRPAAGLHLRQLPGRHRPVRAALRLARPAALREPGADRGLPLRRRLPVLRQTARRGR